MSRIVGPAAGVVLLCWSPVAFAQVEDPPPFVLKWGTSGGGDGQFFFPIGLAPDGAGNIYVADFGNQRVQKFDSDGVFLTAWGMVDQLSQPFGVAADAVGNIYVIGRNVEKFDSNGVLLATWGTFGAGTANLASRRVWRLITPATSTSSRLVTTAFRNSTTPASF